MREGLNIFLYIVESFCFVLLLIRFFLVVPLSVNAMYILVAGFYAVIRLYIIDIYIQTLIRNICMWHHHNKLSRFLSLEI